MKNNKLLYLLGSGASNFGDGIQQIALYWYIYHITGSALSIGVMIAIYYLPSILMTPFLSVIVDYYDSKKIAVFTDVTRGIIVMAMAVLLIFDINSIFIIYAFQFLIAVCYTIYKPAAQSFIKQSFIKQDLPFIISRSNSVNQTMYIIGAGISGALLSQFPIYVFFVVNALSFLLAAFFYWAVKKLSSETKKKKTSYMEGIKDGFRYVNQEKGMKYLLFLSVINSIGIQLAMTIMLPFASELGGGSKLYSILEISFTVGGIIAGLRMNVLIKKYKETVVVFTLLGMCVTSLLLGMAGHFILIIILVFLFGLFTMAHLIATHTFIQLNTSNEMIGRVTGVRTILASLVKITSSLVTGALVAAAGAQNIFLLFCAILLFVGLSYRQMKQIELPALL